MRRTMRFFVYNSTPKIASLGSRDMYSLARRERLIGLHCMILLILKQFHSVSYTVSGMGYGSSYFNSGFRICCLCHFRSFIKLSL